MGTDACSGAPMTSNFCAFSFTETAAAGKMGGGSEHVSGVPTNTLDEQVSVADPLAIMPSGQANVHWPPSVTPAHVPSAVQSVEYSALSKDADDAANTPTIPPTLFQL